MSETLKEQLFRAAAYEDCDAEFQLAQILIAEGGRHSLSEGIRWLERARAHGHTEANRILDKLHRCLVEAGFYRHNDPG